MREILILAAALLAGACAAPAGDVQPYRMTFAPDAWSAEQANALHSAAARWSEVTSRPVELVEVPLGAGVSIVPGALSADVAGHEQGGGVTLRTDLPIDQFEETATHEIGHAMGLEHVRAGIMQGAAGWHGLTFSAEDIEMCTKAGACPQKDR